MNKIYQKIIIFSFGLFFLFTPFIFIYAQEKPLPLEVDYPEILKIKPGTIDTSIAIYFKYVFYFIIASAGIIALIVLIIAGLNYLNSAGNPKKLEESKKQILSALGGIILLLSSWIILRSINPQLLEFRSPELTKTEVNVPPPPSSYTAPSSDVLKRIKDMAEAIRIIPPKISEMAGEMKILINKCDCSNTRSLVLCTGGSSGSFCQTYQCYVGPGLGIDFNPCDEQGNPQGSNPCPDAEMIKKFQKSLIDWKDVLLYYRNRILSSEKPTEENPIIDETSELETDINLILAEKIKYYEDLITEEKKRKEPDKVFLGFLEKELKKLEKEKENKQNLIGLLRLLASAISQAEAPINNLAGLPDKCFSDVKDKCKPISKNGSDYGCHDKFCGCQPEKCQPVDPENPNPCPTEDIEAKIGEIKSFQPSINSISEEIINTINIINNI